MGIAADSFVNNVSEAEGRQEPSAEPEKEETKEESKEEKAADSFVNDVSEAEGRQEPSAEPEKEVVQEEKKEDSKEEKAADSFVNDIYTSEGKQEPCDEEKKDKTLPGNDDENEKPSDGNAEVGKGPEQEEVTNLQDQKSTEVSPENDMDECRETQSSDALNEESPSQPEDDEQEEIKPGVLTVHVIEASNLKNKDIMGKSDPYVEILL